MTKRILAVARCSCGHWFTKDTVQQMTAHDLLEGHEWVFCEDIKITQAVGDKRCLTSSKRSS